MLSGYFFHIYQGKTFTTFTYGYLKNGFQGSESTVHHLVLSSVRRTFWTQTDGGYRGLSLVIYVEDFTKTGDHTWERRNPF